MQGHVCCLQQLLSQQVPLQADLMPGLIDAWCCRDVHFDQFQELASKMPVMVSPRQLLRSVSYHHCLPVSLYETGGMYALPCMHPAIHPTSTSRVQVFCSFLVLWI